MDRPATKRCAMNENKSTTNTKDTQLNLQQDPHSENRWEADRRRKPGKGFAYISTVGWMDRRERLRRKDDAYHF